MNTIYKNIRVDEEAKKNNKHYAKRQAK